MRNAEYGMRNEGIKMKVKQYDKVILKTGESATIVEIFGDGKVFIADIERNEDIDTEYVEIEEIEGMI